jgi:hypothetical protein
MKDAMAHVKVCLRSLKKGLRATDYAEASSNVARGARSKGQRAKGKGQRAKGKEQSKNYELRITKINEMPDTSRKTLDARLKTRDFLTLLTPHLIPHPITKYGGQS